MEQFRPFVDKMPDFFKPWGEEILLRYFDFEGTTDRTTFWHVVLINFIISAVLGALCKVPIIGIICGIVVALYSVAVLIPGIAMSIRRLNDIGKSWPYIFFYFIPCVGWIIMLVFFLQPSAGGNYQ
ncbi:MAG: DUF805 domain-containing protein [Lachnospiraceae bacterium]|nr:DUF805 domain-containing protein [Lachnospiraceae bacterium]